MAPVVPLKLSSVFSESLHDDKPENLPAIGLAGHPCGQGGVCRPSTKCIEGTCKCRQGYNPSFGECIRNLNGEIWVVSGRVMKETAKMNCAQLFSGE